jgi:very-short-patch-repair endonuclease
MARGVHHRPVTGLARGRARHLRRDFTDAELKMWLLLRDRRLVKLKFRRQVPFRNYILDFVCFEHRLIIEIDGSQHADSPRDRQRDLDLAAEGFRVVRYWNNDVLQRPASVLEDLLTHIDLIPG